MEEQAKKLIPIACDHAGYKLKQEIVRILGKEFEFIDLGVFDDEEIVDYPDFATSLVNQIREGKFIRGLLICGTGVGMAIAANKFRGIRAVLASDVYTARMAREHNDTNVLVLGGRVIGGGLAADIVKVWLTTSFAGGRHKKRVEMLQEIEDQGT